MIRLTWYSHIFSKCVYEPSSYSRASFSLSSIKMWKNVLELVYESPIAGALVIKSLKAYLHLIFYMKLVHWFLSAHAWETYELTHHSSLGLFIRKNLSQTETNMITWCPTTMQQSGMGADHQWWLRGFFWEGLGNWWCWGDERAHQRLLVAVVAPINMSSIVMDLAMF